MHEAFRHRALGWLSRMVSRHAVLVLIIAVLLALGSVWVSTQYLSFDANRDDLISHQLPWFKRYLVWNKMFGTIQDVVVVDTYNKKGKPDPAVAADARKLVDQLGPALAANSAVKKALWGFPNAAVSPKTIRLLPLKQFKDRLNQMREAQPLLQSPTPQALLRHLGSMAHDHLSFQPSTTRMVDDLSSFAGMIDAFTTRLNTPAAQPVDLMKHLGRNLGMTGWHYLTSPNGRMLLIPLVPNATARGMNPLENAMGRIRGLLTRFHAKFPDVSVGLTGADALAADETAVTTSDTTKASIISVILIAALLFGAFQSIRKPLMLMAALLIAIAWSFGFLTLVVGHLQVISVVFTVMLLGLGVAFGIHVATRFELVRHNYPDDEQGFTQALQDTLETTGPGLLTGAVTTSAAFGTTMLTDFTGVAEMGLIAGAGVLLCLISMVTVFPAFLRLFRSGHRHVKPMAERKVHFFQERWVMPMSRHPKTTLVIAGIITVASLAAATQIRFNYDLLSLMPPQAPSVIWQRKLVRQGKQSIYSAAVVADSLTQARTLTKQFRRLDSVESVQGIGLLFPRHDTLKLEATVAARKKLGPALNQALNSQSAHPSAQPNAQPAGSLVNQLAAFRLLLGAFADAAPRKLQPGLAKVNHALDRFLRQARKLSTKTLDKRLAALQRDYTRWRSQTAHLIDAALSLSPITPSDLPRDILSQYIAHMPSGTRYSLQIMPNVPKQIGNPLAPAFLGHFARSLQKIDPRVTGGILQIYYSGKLIWRSYLEASLYAFAAVLLLVWLDFHNLRDAGLSLLPVALGFAATFGIMWCIGEKVNPANIIVLPLMFGIGVDAGVHILHRYRQDPVNRPLGLTAGTGKGISLTSYTTMIGFGSLLIAHHRGIRSLGLVLAMGIGMTLLACWTVMPACLELLTRRRETHHAAKHSQNPAA